MADRPLTISYKGKRLRVGDIGRAIAELPRAIRGKALLHVSNFMLKKLRLYPRYKQVARSKAYPEVNGFFSDKQRRFVMAAIADGRIQPGTSHRTQEAKRGWHISKKDGQLSRLSIVNETPAAVFLYHPIYQARQLGMVGWKNVDDMVQENQDEAFRDLQVFIYNELPETFDKEIKK